MKKQQLDDLTFLNIYEKSDFKNSKTLFNILASCERVFNSYRDIIDPTDDINKLKDMTTTLFLNNSDILIFILYSKKDCAVGKRKPIAFSYLSSKTDEHESWTLEFIENRYDFDTEKVFILNESVNFLKKLGIKKLFLSDHVEKNKPVLKGFSLENEKENIETPKASQSLETFLKPCIAQYYLDLKVHIL